MIRPQNIRIAAEGSAEGESQVKLTGKVEHREFLGGQIRYSVLVGEHTLVVEDKHQVDRPTFDVGEAVMLGLETGKVQILRG